MNLKQNLKDFYKIIEDVDGSILSDGITKHLIFADLGILEQATYNCKEENDIWSYNIQPMRIKLPNKPAKCFPSEVENIEIILEVRNKICTAFDNKQIADPIVQLQFDILVTCDTTGNLCSWHLDKHSQSSNDENGDNKYIHPEYHFSYGGKRMEDQITEFGQTLLLRSPRLMHPPLDVILGIDFVINQYIHKDYSKHFTSDSTYQKIVAEMKQLIWKPYCLALANNFHTTWTAGLSFEQGYSELLVG